MFRATVGKVAIFIDATPEFPKEVLNAGPGDIFHKNEKDVDSGDTKLAAGSVVEITEGTWFVSTTTAEGVFRELKAGNFIDLVTTDDLTVGDKLIVNGEAELNGDLNHDGAKVGFFGIAPAARPKKKAPAEVTAKELAEALETLGLVEH